jgi:hypothetical protein
VALAGFPVGIPRDLARQLKLSYLPFRTANASVAAPKGGLSAFPNRANPVFSSLPIVGGNDARAFDSRRAFGKNPYYGRVAQSRLARTLRTRASVAHRLAGFRR